MSAASTYLLDNASEKADTRMEVLARLYDPTTRRVIEATGLAAGWSCLEVGGGGGSVARWLAERVGPAGRVLCTDLDTRIIERGSAAAGGNLEVRRHDIAHDELPREAFDLAHARLVMIHVPERERALENMVRALKPGGWLVIEDFDTASLQPDAHVNRFETPLPTSEAVRKYLTRHQDGYYGRRLHGRFRELGLVEVSAEARMVMFDRAQRRRRPDARELRTDRRGRHRRGTHHAGADRCGPGDAGTRRLRDSVTDPVERDREEPLAGC